LQEARLSHVDLLFICDGILVDDVGASEILSWLSVEQEEKTMKTCRAGGSYI
jgi:hypothetical protein